MLAPTVVVTAVAWLLLLAAAMLGAGPRPAAGRRRRLRQHRASLFAAAFLLAPALIALADSWCRTAWRCCSRRGSAIGATRARGIDAMGQRMLLLAGNAARARRVARPGDRRGRGVRVRGLPADRRDPDRRACAHRAAVVVGRVLARDRRARTRPGPDGPERGGSGGEAGAGRENNT
ncbi:MAG: hypothetical protein M0C28_13565 [Candidatus Moduliflexus flocculans]|nr:hypothetical protein [Candidatus Moduliflexus flocculans]